MASEFDLQLPTPVDGLTATHAEYDKFAPLVQRCRDTVEGDDKIKEAGTLYLSMLEEESRDEYDARRRSACVFDAADKTLDAMLGALFTKPPTTLLPDAITPHLENIDLAGTPYEGFRQTVASERLETGRVAVFVDYSAEQARPFFRLYEWEQIRNWQTRIVGGRAVLSQVVLCETIGAPAATGFGSASVEQYRVLELDAAGKFISRVFTRPDEADPKAQKFIETVTTPSIHGRPWMGEIPFVCFGRLDLSPQPQKPPLLSIANLQLDHYRLSVDQRHALHLGAMGGLFVIGDGDPELSKRYYLGGTRANRLAAGASAEFVEFQGGVLEQIKSEKAAIQERIGLLGVRMLLAPKREAETAAALAIQRDGETASLSTISYGISLGLTKCWRFYAMWMGLNSKDVSDTLNRDFVNHRLSPEETLAQMQLVQSGYLSEQSFIENLFAGEISRDPETERDRIDTQPPRVEPGDGNALVDDETNAADAAA
ncbi:MAG: DUF4055 domain-containing protein [bacterium]